MNLFLDMLMIDGPSDISHNYHQAKQLLVETTNLKYLFGYSSMLHNKF